MSSNALHQDFLIVKKIVQEGLRGNPDAKHFISQAQQGLVLIAIYENNANNIEKISNQLALDGKQKLALDGKQIANRLIANAKILRYEIASSVRLAWNGKGETPIPETDGVVSSFDIVKSAFPLRSSATEISDAYRDLSRFFLKNKGSTRDKSEKQIIFTAKNYTPIPNKMVKKEILMYLNIKENPTASFLMSWFKIRIKQNG